MRVEKRTFTTIALAIPLAIACSAEPSIDGTSPPGEPAAPSSPPGRGGASAPEDAPQAPPAPAPAPAVDPGPPAVQLIGRFDDRDPRGPLCGWPGCRIVARFEGTTVRVKLSETPLLDGPSEWDVTVDGQRRPKLVLEAGAHDYVLASDLGAGPHVVELYKRTEGQNGVTQFLGYDFDGGTLLSPPLRRTRRLEIIGDSDVAGFGYEGTAYDGVGCPGNAWAARWENFRGAWGERLAETLDAELHAAVYSGKGFFFNIWRPDTETIGVVYPRANPVDPESRWDFSTWTPDVVVIALGGNDYNLGMPEDTGPAPLEGVTAKVRELTQTVRMNHPAAQIFLMAYAVLTDAYPEGRLRRTNIETALKSVRDEHRAAGDPRVTFVAPAQYDPAELTGCDGHGGPSYHQRVAAFLAGEIAARTGW